MIRFSHVTMSFGGRRVIDDLTFTLPTSGVLALTGPNGAGKSTVLKLVLGLLVPDSGTIEGVDRPAAAVFQEDRLCDQLTAVANVRLVLPGRPRRADASATSCPQWSTESIVAELAAAGLPEAAMDRPVRQLSGGERRRICLVRAMMAPADIICLDEPFTGLDATLDQAIEYVWARLAGRDTLLVTHSAHEAEALADEVLAL